MGYSYQQGGNFFEKYKHLLIAAVIIFFVGTFYFVSSTMTGYVTYSKSLESQLNATRDALLMSQEQKEECRAALETANGNLNILNSNLNSCNSDLSSYKQSLESCNIKVNQTSREKSQLSDSLSSCKSELAASQDAYKQLARNSVKAICCSFGDIQSGAVRNWNITNNSIVCSGSYTINCTSGESNY